VIDELEERYVAFPGLNLTFETREGILKHCSKTNARALGALGERFLERRQPGLEAQLANLADEIAYNNHDLDDGLRAGLLTVKELSAVSLFARQHAAVRRRATARGAVQARTRVASAPRRAGGRVGPIVGARRVPARVLVHETVRRMIDAIVTDLIDTTRDNVLRAAPASIEEVRRLPRPLVALGALAAEHRELKTFLNRSLYRHERVLAMNRRARMVVRALFERYMNDVHAMPEDHAARALDGRRRCGDAGAARAVADYLAGMTDRYAVAAYRRLVDPKLAW
jgi:dGTPase